MLPGPAGRYRGVSAEGVEVDCTKRGEVMVAGQTDVAAFGQKLQALRRLGAVTDRVTEAPDFVDIRPVHSTNNRFQSGQVCVDVGNYGNAHGLARTPGRTRIVGMMNSGSGPRVGLKLSILAGVALTAILLAWGLAFLFALPLQTGPLDLSVAERVIQSHFNPAELARAQDFRAGQRLLGLAGLAVEFGLLALLAFYRGKPLRRVLTGLGRRPLLGAAAAGIGISLLLALAGLPLGLIAADRGREYDLLTQSGLDWFRDFGISTGINALIAAVGAAVAMLLWRRFRSRFWLAGTALVIGYAVLSVWLWPVVISPVFNRFEPLPPGPVRAEVMRLAQEAGVDVGQVYEVDASRRSSTINAYVNGIGSTKRVVIYDNALRDLNRSELESLIAHELGHVRSNDLPRGLLFAVLIIPLGVLGVQLGTMTMVRRVGRDPAGPGIIPALALSVAVATLLLSVPGNWLSRQVEANADHQAIELTDDPRGLIGMQLKLARKNLSDPDPPGLFHFLFGSHPSTVQRIGMAEALEKPE